MLIPLEGTLGVQPPGTMADTRVLQPESEKYAVTGDPTGSAEIEAAPVTQVHLIQEPLPIEMHVPDAPPLIVARAIVVVAVPAHVVPEYTFIVLVEQTGCWLLLEPLDWQPIDW